MVGKHRTISSQRKGRQLRKIDGQVSDVNHVCCGLQLFESYLNYWGQKKIIFGEASASFLFQINGELTVSILMYTRNALERQEVKKILVGKQKDKQKIAGPWHPSGKGKEQAAAWSWKAAPRELKSYAQPQLQAR